MAKRKTITVSVTLSVHPGVSKSAAVRELRSRVNELCGYATYRDLDWGQMEEADVRVRKVSNP